MTNRVTSRIVTFTRPFVLDEIDHEIPPGNYMVETEEERLDNVSFIAYRRISTRIFVPPAPGASSTLQMWTIHPNGLAFALSRDKVGAF